MKYRFIRFSNDHILLPGAYLVERDGVPVGFVQRWDGIYGCNWKAWRINSDGYRYYGTRREAAEAL